MGINASREPTQGASSDDEDGRANTSGDARIDQEEAQEQVESEEGETQEDEDKDEEENEDEDEDKEENEDEDEVEDEIEEDEDGEQAPQQKEHEQHEQVEEEAEEMQECDPEESERERDPGPAEKERAPEAESHAHRGELEECDSDHQKEHEQAEADEDGARESEWEAEFLTPRPEDEAAVSDEAEAPGDDSGAQQTPRQGAIEALRCGGEACAALVEDESPRLASPLCAKAPQTPPVWLAWNCYGVDLRCDQAVRCEAAGHVTVARAARRGSFHQPAMATARRSQTSLRQPLSGAYASAVRGAARVAEAADADEAKGALPLGDEEQASPPLTPARGREAGSPVNGESSGGRVIGDYAQHLLDVVDELRSLDVNEIVGFNLPKMVVVGEQSSGKSSLLQALTGIPLPRSRGTCTRCPIELRMRRNEMVQGRRVAVFKGSESNPVGGDLSTEEVSDDTVARLIHEAHEKITGGKTFKNTPVIVRIEGADLPNLTVVDLPGIISHAPANSSDGKAKEEILNMVRSAAAIVRPQGRDAAQDSGTPPLVLLVTPFAEDIERCKALELVRHEIDAAFERTFLVLTHTDSQEVAASPSERNRLAATYVDQWLRCDNGRRRVGFVMTLQEGAFEGGDAMHKREQMWQEADERTVFKERKFLEHFGVPRLRQRLSEYMERCVRAALPTLQLKVQSKLREIEEEIEQLPPPPPADPSSRSGLIMRLIDDSFHRCDLWAMDGIPSLTQNWDALRKELSDFERRVNDFAISLPGAVKELFDSVAKELGAGTAEYPVESRMKLAISPWRKTRILLLQQISEEFLSKASRCVREVVSSCADAVLAEAAARDLAAEIKRRLLQRYDSKVKQVRANVKDVVADCSFHFHHENAEVHGPAGSRVPAAANPVHAHFWALIDEQLKKAASAIMSVLQHAQRDADVEVLRSALGQEQDRIVCFAWLGHIDNVDLVSLAARANELRLPQAAAASVAATVAGAAAAAANSSSVPQQTGLFGSLVGGGSSAASNAAAQSVAAAAASALANGAASAVRNAADTEQRFFERFCEIKSVRRLREHMHRLLLSNVVSARTCASIVPKIFQHKIVSSFEYLRPSIDESDSTNVNALTSQDALFEESAEAAERRAQLRDQMEKLKQADAKLEELCV